MNEDIAKKVIELYDEIEYLNKVIKDLQDINEYHRIENGELRKSIRMWKDNAEYWQNRSNTLNELLTKK